EAIRTEPAGAGGPGSVRDEHSELAGCRDPALPARRPGAPSAVAQGVAVRPARNPKSADRGLPLYELVDLLRPHLCVELAKLDHPPDEVGLEHHHTQDVG